MTLNVNYCEDYQILNGYRPQRKYYQKTGSFWPIITSLHFVKHKNWTIEILCTLIHVGQDNRATLKSKIWIRWMIGNQLGGWICAAHLQPPSLPDIESRRETPGAGYYGISLRSANLCLPQYIVGVIILVIRKLKPVPLHCIDTISYWCYHSACYLVMRNCETHFSRPPGHIWPVTFIGPTYGQANILCVT